MAIPLSLAFWALVGACSSISGPDEDVLTLEVASETVPCVAVIEQECLQVRTPGESEWELFYDEISGFTHEPGFSYLIEVARRTIENPPADASGYSYRLLAILVREPVA